MFRGWFKKRRGKQIREKEDSNDQKNEMSKLLDEPWRELRWGTELRDVLSVPSKVQEDRQYVQEYKPAKDDIRYLRVLLYGPVGAGKSSLINSVSNVFRGRVSSPALASATLSNQSFTTMYQTHKFIEGQGSSKTIYPVVFIDMMGLEEGDNRGVHENDIKLALQGHVKEGHKFNPVSPLTQRDPGYNPTPSADDKVHVLVCVMSANALQIKSSILQKMKNVRERASELGIPQIAIMTHIDGLCGEIQKDLKNVYMSKQLRKKMRDFSAAVGIPMNCIFPVKNYSHEINLKDDIDTLTLSALRKMIDFGDDFIEKI